MRLAVVASSLVVLLGCSSAAQRTNGPSIAGCASGAECASQLATTEPCRAPTCREGRCVLAPAHVGIAPGAAQKATDCKRLVCSAGGDLVSEDDPADVPIDDGDPCTKEICASGAPGHVPSAAGTACGEIGACNGEGACVTVEDVASGKYHACARMSDGSVKCWGGNDRGELGDGSNESRAVAAPVARLENVVEIAVGGSHACARLRDGTVRCWGANDHGQLGDGTTSDHPIPIDVAGLRGATSISLGVDHACARLGDGTVRCWGANADGQIGRGDREDALLPVSPAGLANVVEVSAGGAHTCARLADRSVKCWGKNDHGQLGDGTVATRTKPVAIPKLRADAITAGRFHTCALVDGGRATCWGWNTDGQLGDGTTVDRTRPEPVHDLDRAISLAAGNGHTCAILTGGAVRCWGWDAYGQLGDGGGPNQPAPITCSAATAPARRIALGSKHTCALLTNGEVTCWGDGSRGQLGEGGTVGRRD